MQLAPIRTPLKPTTSVSKSATENVVTARTLDPGCQRDSTQQQYAFEFNSTDSRGVSSPVASQARHEALCWWWWWWLGRGRVTAGNSKQPGLLIGFLSIHFG